MENVVTAVHTRESLAKATLPLELNGQYESIKAAATRLGYDDPHEYLMALHEMYSSGQLHVPPKGPARPDPTLPYPRPVLHRPLGTLYQGDSAALMLDELEPGSIDLVVTSPPFGLVQEKAYGNEDADEYVDWFEQFAAGFERVLKETGSLVIDIGGAYKKGLPVRSLYHFELVIRLCRAHGFHLAQEFYWWNPAKLPLPAEWVNVRRIRVRDSVNCVWWLSKSPFPPVSNKRVLQPYSKSMLELFERGSYNTGERAGGHKPGEKSFLTKHGGSIPHNLIAIANTDSNSGYQQCCRDKGIPVHPARFPLSLPAFFIRMLTDPGQTVLDPFAGSAATGEVAERMGRRWICCELDKEYVEGAVGRFNEAYEPSPIELNRNEPYAAYPPVLSTLPEEEAPLVADGGRKRPQRQDESSTNGQELYIRKVRR